MYELRSPVHYHKGEECHFMEELDMWLCIRPLRENAYEYEIYTIKTNTLAHKHTHAHIYSCSVSPIQHS